MNVTYFDPTQAHAPENMTAGIRPYLYYIRWGIGVTVFALSIVYLVMLNALATQGFDMESLKAQQLELHKQVEAVDISLAIPSSIYALESNEQIQNMPGIDRKKFIGVDSRDFAWLQNQ